jgi:hypothetical protein
LTKTGRRASFWSVEHLFRTGEKSRLECRKTARAGTFLHSRTVELASCVTIVRFQDFRHPVSALVPADLVPQIVHHPTLTESPEEEQKK